MGRNLVSPFLLFALIEHFELSGSFKGLKEEFVGLVTLPDLITNVHAVVSCSRLIVLVSTRIYVFKEYTNATLPNVAQRTTSSREHCVNVGGRGDARGRAEIEGGVVLRLARSWGDSGAWGESEN